MSQLAAEGAQKGYIKKTKTEAGYTYAYIRPGQSTSGKMGAKDIAATANKIAQFARNNIEERGLSGEELKHIEQGMARLQVRMRGHKPSLFQSMKKLTAIANNLFQPNYKTDLENVIKDRPAPILTQEDNNAITTEHLRSTGPETLKAVKNKKLINKFKNENETLINKLRSFDGNDTGVIAATQANRNLTEAYRTNPDQTLLDTFKAKVRNNLTEKCSGRNLPDVATDPEFRQLLSKYRETFPADSANKTDAALVREITGLTTFNESRPTVARDIQEFARPLVRPLTWFNERLNSALERAGAGVKKVGKGIKKRVISAFKTSEGTKASSKQIRETASSSAASSSPQAEPTMGERLASLVLKEETPVDATSRVFNRLRNVQFNKIVTRTSIVESKDNQQTSFVKYVRKSIWGAFVGNVGEKTREQIQTSAPKSEQDKRELEGENTVAHMFYMYNLLEAESKTNQDPNMTTLRGDLERSLPFAFEASVIGGNKEREDILSHQIYEKLATMDIGQAVYLPIGCDGHATLLMMTKTAEGRVQIQHFNTGLGLREQQRLAGDNTFSLRNLWNGPGGYPIAVGFEVDLTRSETQTNVEAALGYFINTASYEGTTMEEVTRALVKLNDLAGFPGEGITATVRREKPQQTGNCSYRCLIEGARNRLGVTSYRKFKTSYSNQLETNLRGAVEIKPRSADDLLLQDLSMIRGKARQPQVVQQAGSKSRGKRRNHSESTKSKRK
jgi:hypothetical protein